MDALRLQYPADDGMCRGEKGKEASFSSEVCHSLPWRQLCNGDAMPECSIVSVLLRLGATGQIMRLDKLRIECILVNKDRAS